MKKIVTTVIALSVSALAAAQTSNFEGFSGALNLNTVSTNTKLSASDGSFDGIGQQSWNGSLQAAYGFAMGPRSVVSVGGTYGLGSSKAGVLRDADGAAELTLKSKNQLSLYVEPGLLATDKTLIYGKVSYERAKGVLADTDADGSRSMRGTGLGLGLRTMLDKNTFLQVEFKQVTYRSIALGDDASAKSKATVGTVGIGMKF